MTTPPPPIRRHRQSHAAILSILNDQCQLGIQVLRKASNPSESLTSMGHDDAKSLATGDGDAELTKDQNTATTQPRDDDDESTIREVKEEGIETSLKAESSVTSPAHFQHPKEEEHLQPLPPRPTNANLLQEGSFSPASSLQRLSKISRPRLQSTATTALSRTDIHTQSYQDGSRDTFAALAQTTPPSKAAAAFGSIKRIKGVSDSEGGDSASVRSYAPTLETGGDVESLLGEVLGASQESPAWKLHSTQNEALDQFNSISYEDNELDVDFYREFDEIDAVAADGENEGKH